MSGERRSLAWNELLALALLGLFWGLGPTLLTFGDLFKVGSDQAYAYGWGRMLHELPLHRFYATDMGAFLHLPHPGGIAGGYGRPDHLPTDIAALKLLELLYTGLGGSSFAAGWLFLFALFQVLNAVALAFGLYLLVRMLRGPGPVTNAVLVVSLLDPLVPIAAYLLRWDFFPADLAVWLLVVLVRTRGRLSWWLVAGVLAALVALSKPQYLLVVAPLVLCHLAGRRRAPGAVVAGLGLAGAGALATAGLLLALFGLGPGSVVNLYRYAFAKYPYVTDAAGNLWQVLEPQRRIPTADGGYVWTVRLDSHSVAGLSFLVWGWAVFAVLASVTVVVFLRWRGERLTKVAWLATALYLDYWWATTRQTERYLLPALIVALLLLAATWEGRHRIVWAGVVLALWLATVAQVVAANWRPRGLPATGWLLSLVLAAFLLVPLWERRRGSSGVLPLDA